MMVNESAKKELTFGHTTLIQSKPFAASPPAPPQFATYAPKKLVSTKNGMSLSEKVASLPLAILLQKLNLFIIGITLMICCPCNHDLVGMRCRD